MAKRSVGISEFCDRLRIKALGHETDQELLNRLLTAREEVAFAALFERHGPMVLGLTDSCARR